MNKAIERYRGVQISAEVWISVMEYADDVVIPTDTPENLNPVLDRINHFSNSVGLEINISKIKIFTTYSSAQHVVRKLETQF